MKLKTLKGKEAKKETKKITVTKGTMKRRETRMESNGISASRDRMQTRRMESPRLNKKFQRLESIHQNLANQMIAMLNTLNKNIVSLGDSLMSARFGGDMMEKANLDIG